jgi:hypothetical protein
MCKCKGFFVYTPDGADYSTCPCCGEYDFVNNTLNKKHTSFSRYNELLEAWEQECDFGKDQDMRFRYPYCEKCGIMFDSGCIHHMGGCTSSVYCAHFIKRWRDKSTDTVYTMGMPHFDSAEDWFEHANDVEVNDDRANRCKADYGLVCPHQGAICASESNMTKNGHYYGCGIKNARNQGSEEQS